MYADIFKTNTDLYPVTYFECGFWMLIFVFAKKINTYGKQGPVCVFHTHNTHLSCVQICSWARKRENPETRTCTDPGKNLRQKAENSLKGTHDTWWKHAWRAFWEHYTITSYPRLSPNDLFTSFRNIRQSYNEKHWKCHACGLNIILNPFYLLFIPLPS